MGQFDDYRAQIGTLAFITFAIVAFMLAVNALRDDRLAAIGGTQVYCENQSLSSTTNSTVLTNNYVQSVQAVYINSSGAFSLATSGTNYTLSNDNKEAAPTITFITLQAAGTNQTRINYTYIDEYASVASNVTLNGALGLYNSTSQFSAIGTLMGVFLIIAAIVGIFYYVKD